MRMPGPSSSPNPATSATGRYVREFDLAYRYYPRREKMLRWIGGRLHTEEMLADPKVLAGFGLNQREVRYLAEHPFWDLASLYYRPYLDSFHDEYRPFDAGLNALDALSTTELFKKDGASAGALGFIGGRGRRCRPCGMRPL